MQLYLNEEIVKPYIGIDNRIIELRTIMEIYSLEVKAGEEYTILGRKNIAKGVVYALTAIILFVVVKIILSIVVSLIDGIAKLPILKQFNEVGGMAYGIVSRREADRFYKGKQCFSGIFDTDNSNDSNGDV